MRQLIQQLPTIIQMRQLIHRHLKFLPKIMKLNPLMIQQSDHHNQLLLLSHLFLDN
jgi:hypothetical protein